MLEWLNSLDAWHWISFGFILLIVDIFITAGFFIGIVVAAMVIGLLLFILNIPWQLQLFLFGVLSLVFTIVYWKKFRKFNEVTDRPLLNNRAAQMIGTRLVLENDINEFGKVSIGDTLWSVKSEGHLAAGQTVTIKDVDGMTLLISALEA